MALRWLAMLKIAYAVVVFSALSASAQQFGLPIPSNTPVIPPAFDRNVPSSGSSPVLASPMPIAMTPNLFSGALNVTVSIAVPPAKGRVMPPLTLAYDSLRGEGPVGVGWTLMGGSIARSPRFGLEYDGGAFVLTLGSTSVDLIRVGGGVYRDKLDALRVEAVQVPSSPDVFSWRVTDAYGTKYFFGSSEGSRRQALNGQIPEISEWHLDRIEDLSGNFSTLEYQSNTGYLYLRTVKFTGNTRVPLDAHNRIEVSYESRPLEELTTSFATNHESLVALRVRSVIVSARAHFYAGYLFSYSQSGQTNKSLLTGISRYAPPQGTPISGNDAGQFEINANQTPLSRVTFAYSDRQHTDNWTISDNFEGPARDHRMYYQCIPGDFNGDGKTDLACATNRAGQWSVGISRRAILNAGSDSPNNHAFNGFETTNWPGPVVTKTVTVAIPLSRPPGRSVTVPDVRNTCFTGDFNGDNIDDIGCYDPSNRRWQIGVSITGRFLVKTWTTGPTMPSGTSTALGDRCTPGDFNGDGLTDLACLVSGATNAGRWSVAIVTPNGWQTDNGWAIEEWPNGPAPPASPALSVATACRSGDFNGDRRADITCFDSSANTWHVGISTGGGFATRPWDANSQGRLLTSSQTIASRCVEGDFNADGKTDFACYRGSEGAQQIGRWALLLSTGSNWKTTNWIGGRLALPDPNAPIECFTGDFNGDGKGDFACRALFPPNERAVVGWWAMFLAAHDRFISKTVRLGGGSWFGTASEWGSCMAGDFNGDAKTDLLCDWDRGNRYELNSPEAHDTDRLTSVHTATGLTASFDYGSSSDQVFTTIGFPIPVLARMSLNAGAMTSTTTYEYDHGAYKKSSREFRGFNHVRLRHAITQNGHQRIDDVWFFQGDGLNRDEPTLPSGLQDLAAGSPYRSIVSDGSQQLLASMFRYEGRSVTQSTNGEQILRLVERRTSFSGDPATNPDRVQTFNYDANGNMVQISDQDLKTVGSTGLRIRTTYSDDRDVHAFGYPLTVEVSDLGQRRLEYTTYRYDEPTCGARPSAKSFLVTSVDRWINDTSTAKQQFGYGPSGNLVCRVDENGGSTSLSYDSDAEYVLSLTNPLRQQTTFTYYGVERDEVHIGMPGLLRTIATNRGEDITQYEYDAVGRPTMITAPDSSSIKFDYNNVGDPSSQNVRSESSAGLVRTQYVDGLGRIYKSLSTGPGGKIVMSTKAYDPTGWVTTIDEPQLVDDPAGPTPPSRVRVRTEYDALGRPLATIDSTGRMNRKCYDGLHVVTLDANGHARRTTSDVFGRPVSIEEFDDQFANCDALSQRSPYATTLFKYDPLGRMQRVEKGGAVVSEFTYDGRGNVTRIKNVDRGEVRFQYDLAGRLRRVAEPGKTPINYSRDPLGRLKRIASQSAGGARTLWAFSYDEGPHAEGRLSSSTSPNYNASYRYAAHGNNVVHVVRIGGHTYTLSRQYDAVDRIIGIDYPDGRHLTYSHDGPVLASISEGTRSYVVARGFNAYLNPARLEFDNGTVETLDYGLGGDRAATDLDPCASVPSDQLCRIAASLGGNQVRSILYRYDSALNVTGIDDSVDGMRTFTYDALDRLTSELTQDRSNSDPRSAVPTTYAYDALGRRTSTSFQGPYLYRRDTLNARPSLPTSIGSASVQTDPVGHIVRVGANRYDFNLLGQLTRVTTPNRQVSYSYDWLGNLLQRTQGRSTVTFPNRYLTCSGTRCDDLVLGYGGVSAKLTRDGNDYYNFDRLGTRFAVTTSDGQLKNNLSYSAYGVLDAPNTVDGEYAGHPWDSGSGLYWFGSRFYDPAIGQFVSPDSDSWLIAGITDPYEYAFRNPLRWIDPTGHQGQSVSTTLPWATGGPLPPNIFPSGGGGGPSFNPTRPNFGGGASNRQTWNPPPPPVRTFISGPGDVFAFFSGGVSVGNWILSGGVEGVLLGGYSLETGGYVGVIAAGGPQVLGDTFARYAGTEYIWDFPSLKPRESEPITLKEINVPFTEFGGGRYEQRKRESGFFIHVGVGEHFALGIGLSDTAANVLIRMVTPAGSLRDPRFGCCDESPYPRY